MDFFNYCVFKSTTMLRGRDCPEQLHYFKSGIMEKAMNYVVLFEKSKKHWFVYEMATVYYWICKTCLPL